jgi:hypothetical protein
MNSENKICQNCKAQFVIEPEDFAFCEKMQVPPPTWCPQCRAQRRFVWRNERTLYKRDCDLCHKTFIGLYPKGVPFPVYCHDCWFSDKWDPLSYGVAYDFKKPFFEQFKELGRSVPRLAIWIQQSTNSEYTNQSYTNKNAYLSFALRDSEDVAYCTYNVGVRQCLDSTYTHHSEFLYESVDTEKSYRGRFLEETEACVDSGFLTNCRNCNYCLGGINLRSVSYVLFGERLDKETYLARMMELDLGSRAVQQQLAERLQKLRSGSIFRFANLLNTTNATGDHLFNAKNCHFVFDGFELENARYSSWVFTSKEISDCYGMGGSEFVYEGIGVEEVHSTKFCNVTDGSHDVEYCDLCSASANLFGCIALRSKEYCILNTQYSKEEYTAMVAKIKDQMSAMPYVDKAGRTYVYGEFFPPELSPFAYNETIAQENYALTRETAIAQGYSWKEPNERNYAITIASAAVPDNIDAVQDAVINEVIGCAHGGKCNHQCSTAFRIVPQELQFYRQMRVPLPTLCPNCRHHERLHKRNPRQLWERTCQCAGATSQNGAYANTAKHIHGSTPCANRFMTSYALERLEIIYCEQCYNSEIA